MSTDPSQEYPGLVPDIPGPDHRGEPAARELISWLTPAVRRWLYLVLLTAVPLLIAYGAISDETAPLWIALGGAVLGMGVAEAHTPPSKAPAARN